MCLQQQKHVFMHNVLCMCCACVVHLNSTEFMISLVTSFSANLVLALMGERVQTDREGEERGRKGRREGDAKASSLGSFHWTVWCLT